MRSGDAGSTARRRIAVAQVALLLAFVVLAVRAAHLSVLDERGFLRGLRQLGFVLDLAPERGAILDRSGRELALSVDAPSIYAEPARIEDRDAAAAALARALGRPRSEIAPRLTGKGSFVFLARWASPEVARRVEALGLRGVGIVYEPRRVYPYKELAAQIVGFANIDGEGVRGIEQAEDAWLRGVGREVPVERDGSGDLLVDTTAWSTAGGDVALTLDAGLQSDAVLALRESLAATGARSGVVVSLDPATGDVLALAEAPGFDPNRFRELDYTATRSHAFLDAIEPGSTFKAFLAAAALERGGVRPSDRFDCEGGTYLVANKTIRDLKPHDRLTLSEILRVSSNIGAVKVAFQLGPEPYQEVLRGFGFGAPTGSGFPDESSGVLRTVKRNRPVDQANLAFGQGVGVTPVQLAAATAALANEGRWLRPRLVAGRRKPGGAWELTRPDTGRAAVSPATAAAVLEMLETVTGPEGTGKGAGLRGVRVAGKTGTAQKFDAERGVYSDRRFVAWFAGVVPADAPRLVVVVALDEPRRPLHTGGASAAPLFARVAAAQLTRLGISTEPEPARPLPAWTTAEGPAAPEAPAPARRAAPPAVAAAPPVAKPPEPVPVPVPVPDVSRLADRVLLPDLHGLTVAQVKAVTDQAQIRVEITGSGRAVAQDPPPGTVVGAQRDRVRVRFEPTDSI
jgi:cell division protein FtsI (penicillin-binding protein 3)